MTQFRAFVEARLDALGITDPAATASATAELNTFFGALPEVYRDLLPLVVHVLDAAARRHFGAEFQSLSVADRRTVMRRTEFSGDPLTAGFVGILMKATTLVLGSRDDVRAIAKFQPSSRLGVQVDLPPPAPVDDEYDVCIVGSGAGGASIADEILRLRPNTSVVIVEEGGFLSPHQLPRRDDDALRLLYRDAGVQMAFRLGDAFEPGKLSPINVLQARVVGGGPLINNAIHLRMSEDTFENKWRSFSQIPWSFTELAAAYDAVEQDLHPSKAETQKGMGERSALLLRAAQTLGLQPDLLPNVVHDCLGCGECNLGCPFGRKIGGLGSAAFDATRESHLERALRRGAKLRSGFRAVRLKMIGRSTRKAATWLDGRDLTSADPNHPIIIKAKEYVFSAGPVASTRLLMKSNLSLSPPRGPLGTRFSGNIVTPVFARFDHEIHQLPLHDGAGLPMCVFLNETTSRPMLESWFHFPASLAVGFPLGFEDQVDLFQNYDRLAACGIVLPSEPDGVVHEGPAAAALAIRAQDLQSFSEGIISLAELYFAEGATEVYPSTTRPFVIRKGHLAEDGAALRQFLRGPADINLATAHPQGGNPIHISKRHGVVDEDFRVHGADNVTLADASIFPAGCRTNPQMTVMALAKMAARRLVDRL